MFSPSTTLRCLGTGATRRLLATPSSTPSANNTSATWHCRRRRHHLLPQRRRYSTEFETTSVEAPPQSADDAAAAGSHDDAPTPDADAAVFSDGGAVAVPEVVSWEDGVRKTAQESGGALAIHRAMEEEGEIKVKRGTFDNNLNGYLAHKYDAYPCAARNVGGLRRDTSSLAALDLPGAVGSVSTVRQPVAVAAYRDASGAKRESVVYDFAFAGDDNGGEPCLEGFAEKGRSVLGARTCTFTLPEATEDGSEVVVHLLSHKAAHVAYHYAAAEYRSGAAAPASEETLEGEWPKEDGRDVAAVTMWTQAVHARRVASVPVQRGRVLFVGEARAVVVNGDPERTDDVREEALKVNPFVGRESLLVSSLRGQTLLLCDYTHAAKVTLCWWYAKKFGRNRAAPLLCANILSYLRSHDAEGLYNATEIHALLHLAAVALFKTSGAASFPAFIEHHPDLLDPDVLLHHYSPELLNARQTRITYMDPDRRSLDGPMNPTDVGRMLIHDSPLHSRERELIIQEGVEGDEDLDFLARGSAPHHRALELLPVKPGREFQGYEDLRISHELKDATIDLGQSIAFGGHGRQPKMSKKKPKKEEN